MRPVHYCSLIPVFLELIFKDKTNDDPIVLSSATGCLYSNDDFLWLEHPKSNKIDVGILEIDPPTCLTVRRHGETNAYHRLF